MGKQIESPIKRWPGQVVLKHPTPLEPYTVWKQCIDDITAQKDNATSGDVASDPTLLRLALPGICAMVQEWRIAGDFPKDVTPDTFPYLPRVPSLKMLVWLIGEINALIAEDDDLPLA